MAGPPCGYLPKRDGAPGPSGRAPPEGPVGAARKGATLRDRSAISRALEPLENFGPDATPSYIRRTVLRVVRDVGEADGAVFFNLVRADGKAPIVLAHEADGACSDAVVKALLEGVDKVDDATLLERPGRSDLEGFRSLGGGDDDEGASAASTEPAASGLPGLTDRARVVVYEGQEFVGWLGALRAEGSPRFSRRQRERLGRYLPELKRALLKAHQIEQRQLQRGTAYVLLTADGVPVNASDAAAGWLAHDGMLGDLIDAVARLERGEAVAPTRLLRAAQAEVVALREPAQQARYLAVLRLAPTLTRAPDASLSAAQRQVAEQAARGNTVDEIAALVGRTPQTVRSYLREAYRRLGVNNRVALARALGVALH